MKERNNLILSLARLDKENIPISGELTGDFLGFDDSSIFELSRPIRYKLEAQMISGNVLVNGGVEMAVAGDCGRCLTPVSREYSVGVTLFYDEIGPRQEELDISDELRTELLLALPVNILCTDECAGLCPLCGGDLNKEPCNCTEEEDPPPAEKSTWGALDDLDV